jgi:hypothetical protein
VVGIERDHIRLQLLHQPVNLHRVEC